MNNLSSPRRSALIARQFALAIALASGTAVLAIPGFTDAAHAQRKKKDEAPEAAKAVYSKEFVAAYQPIDTALKAPDANYAAIKPQLDALAPLAVSPDEKLALGGLLFNAGIVGKDLSVQLQGAETILGSGKAKPDDVGRFSFVASQIATSLNDYDKARSYLQKAIDENYTAENLTTADVRMNMAELYFAQEQYVEGLDYLSDLIDAQRAEGKPVDIRWLRRGVQVAYTNEIVPQVYEFVQGWVSENPTPENWRDAVNLTRNLNDYDGPVLLDLLRLGKKVGTLKDRNDYIFYIEAADTRRLPMEVKSVIEDATATGTIARGSDTWVDEQLKIANGLIAEDRAALPALERDANAPAAKLRTVLAAGDTFLSYGEYAKAANFYERALTMADVDRGLALTRLGIAQIGLGQADAARETLAKVDGTRAPVAMLWSAYATQSATGAPATGG
ncbi:hypothetical protein [Erythrobacter sp. R86502]|uniref:tetratricopeptide repeat protein n=1 Tax=Erythrobacter sp. R86502 TaxID=3093846 RepID=UPI0036D3B87A